MEILFDKIWLEIKLPKDWVFCCGRLEGHGAGQEAGVGAALEVNVVLDTSLVQLIVLDHMVAMAHSVGLELVNRLEYKQKIIYS